MGTGSLSWKHPEGIIGMRPEIVRQSDLHSNGKGAEIGRNDQSHHLNSGNNKCAWPVIDATFRYTIFLLGTLVAHAPFYSGILQGLQVSDVTPYS